MWVYFRKISTFFSFLLIKIMRLKLFFFYKNENINYTVSHLNSPSQKKLTFACIACLWFYCLFSPLFLLLTLFVAIILSTVFFSLLCLVLWSSWILRIARSLLRWNISFKSCTMLFSSLFDFQVNIYLIVCFNLNLFPIFESSPLFFSLTL